MPKDKNGEAKPIPKTKTWNAMQQLAIDTRDKTLLVSAAAGSGKTATLTERIIRSITDVNSPIGIDEMLIVTFTRLAAGELRERIGKAIKAELEKNPNNPHLERQLHLLPSAKICTIDSFCADILRANADRVGISPAFRIPDEAECALIMENILNGMFAEIYAGGMGDVATPEALASLAECLTDTGTESDLATVIAAIRETTVSTLDGADSLLPLVEEYNPNNFTRVEATRFGAYIMSRLRELCEHYEKHLSDAESEIAALGNPSHKNLLDMLAGDLGYVRKLAAQDGYTAAREVISNIPLGNAVSNTDKTLPKTTMLHAALKKDLSAIAKKFFLHTEEEWRTAYAGLYREIGTLYRLIKRFDELFLAEKMRRCICEFSDIERYTYECMWQNGERTDVAISQSKLYLQIYIDEYQDVNSLQDAIFEAISTPTNRFMVGDIKQSIYRFRSANPDIFARMKKTFPEISVAGSSPTAAIFMSDNYRCDRGIIDFTNLVFDRIFGIIGDSIGYVKQDRLECSKYKSSPESEPPYLAPEICLIDSSALKKKNAENPDWDEKMLAPYAVAQKIRELIDSGAKKNDGKPIGAGDIAIIMRTAKGRIGKYKAALDEYGIPAAVADDTRFFLTAEALLALCLLNSIDNPNRDIYLAGLMLSPLYSFTEDEMAFIKRAGGSTLYESLKRFCEDNPSFEKGKAFLEKLSHYRLLSEGTPTDALILRLYHETGLFALAAKNGTKDRLLRLYEYARTFEAGSFNGLYNFISYLNNIIERKNSLDKREAPTDPDAVKIITSHASKGLEFPVVFYVGGEDALGGGGSAKRFEYAEGFGIGLFLRSPSGVTLVRNATKNVISDYAERAELEEEARILYVTLTRARERLYVVAPAGKKMADFDKEIEYSRDYLDSYSIHSEKSMLRLILASTKRPPMEPSEFLATVPAPLSFDDDMSTIVDNSESKNKSEAPVKLDTGEDKAFVAPTKDRAGEIKVHDLYREGQLKSLLDERFAYKYPRLHLTELPEKMSVSVLYPELLDGTDEGVIMLDGEDVERRDEANLRFGGLGILPDFMTGREKDSSAKRGIATHLLFQFCDLERLASEGAEAELNHLVAERFISERDARRVRLDEVEAFRHSRLFEDMRNARKLYREFRFNVRLPAEMFAQTDEARKLYRGESVLVQGVIDCLYEDSLGEYHLIDYKTDRLTKAELNDKEAARAKMHKAHSRQLAYYGEAVKRIFGKEPVTREVYSLHLGDTLSVK